MHQLIEDIERLFAPFRLAVVIILLILLGWAFWRDHNLAVSFDKIAIGTSQKVLQLMGAPKKVLKCGEFFGPPPKEKLLHQGISLRFAFCTMAAGILRDQI